MKLTDIPDKLYNPVTRHIYNYTIGITAPEETSLSAYVQLCGSGTLVEINGIYGILTADHVLEYIKDVTKAALVPFHVT